MPDPEKKRTYEGEFQLREQLKLTTVRLHGTVLTVPQERKFASLESIQQYVDKVLALNWVRKEYPNADVPIKVVRGRAIDIAQCGGGKMYVNPDHTKWALREVVILHEMSHHLVPFDGHGLGFRTCFGWLTQEIIGPEVAWLLRTNWQNLGLRVYNEPSMV